MSTSFWDDGSIYSIAEMRAKEWLKNRADDDVLLLRYRGGIVGGVQQIVISSVRLEIGEAHIPRSRSEDNYVEGV